MFFLSSQKCPDPLVILFRVNRKKYIKKYKCQPSHQTTWIRGPFQPVVLRLLGRMLIQAPRACFLTASSGKAGLSSSVECFMGRLWGKTNSSCRGVFFTRSQVWVRLRGRIEIVFWTSVDKGFFCCKGK